MNKVEMKKQLQGGIIAVIRCKDKVLAEKMIVTAINSGIKAVEITYTVEGAGALINEIKTKYPETIVGAGTVIELAQAEDALKNKADFIVSPCLVSEVAALCKERDIFCSMGAVTATEIFNAYKMGVDVMKLFPGETFSPSIIKSLKAPLPFVDVMPTGGVSDKNVKEWFDNGAFAVGAGGYLTKGITEDNLDVLEARVKSLVAAAK